MKKSNSNEVSAEQILKALQGNKGPYEQGFHSSEEMLDTKLSYEYANSEGLCGKTGGLHKISVPAEMRMPHLRAELSSEKA